MVKGWIGQAESGLSDQGAGGPAEERALQATGLSAGQGPWPGERLARPQDPSRTVGEGASGNVGLHTPWVMQTMWSTRLQGQHHSDIFLERQSLLSCLLFECSEVSVGIVAEVNRSGFPEGRLV